MCAAHLMIRFWPSQLRAQVSEAAILEPGWNYWRRLELLRFQGRAPERRVVSACPRASNTVKSRRLFQLSGLHPTFKDPSSATRDEGRFRASLIQADTSGCPTSFLLPPPQCAEYSIRVGASRSWNPSPGWRAAGHPVQRTMPCTGGLF